MVGGYVQQAAIWCADPVFQQYVCERYRWRIGQTVELAEADADWCAAWVRACCGISSRAALNTDAKAGAMWRKIQRDFLNWKRCRGIG